eukprot:TRINITY_DN4036_c0_g1_i2.p2 TRINITY_DN4036_c0_g1~~TRINITY_DN4036_c0_g1_i2.p2  ORF type:complete len:202 (-),score=15.13 TRINITY_DN4036_c0_g1_i2:60-665(-)
MPCVVSPKPLSIAYIKLYNKDIQLNMQSTMIYGIYVGGQFNISGLYIQQSHGIKLFWLILARTNPLSPNHMEYICIQYQLFTNMEIWKDDTCPANDFIIELEASNHFVKNIKTEFKILATSWKVQLQQQWIDFYSLVIAPLVLSVAVIVSSCLILKHIKQKRYDDYLSRFLTRSQKQGLINSESSANSNFDKVFKESVYTD